MLNARNLICTLIMAPLVGTIELALAQDTTSKVKAKAPSPLSRPYHELETQYGFSQEVLDTSAGAIKGKMRTHLQGINLRYVYNRPTKNLRYVRTYGVDFGYGNLRGKAVAPVEDEVKGQSWMSLTLTPGLEYRSTSQTRVGAVLPITYRSISWKVKAPFEVEDKPFSIGAGILMTQQVGSRSGFIVSVTRQHHWTSTVWAFGWQYRL